MRLRFLVADDPSIDGFSLGSPGTKHRDRKAGRWCNEPHQADGCASCDCNRHSEGKTHDGEQNPKRDLNSAHTFSNGLLFREQACAACRALILQEAYAETATRTRSAFGICSLTLGPE